MNLQKQKNKKPPKKPHRKGSQSSNKTHLKNEIPHQAVKHKNIFELPSQSETPKCVQQVYQLASTHVFEMAMTAKGKQKHSEYTSHEYFPVSTAERKIKLRNNKQINN